MMVAVHCRRRPNLSPSPSSTLDTPLGRTKRGRREKQRKGEDKGRKKGEREKGGREGGRGMRERRDRAEVGDTS